MHCFNTHIKCILMLLFFQLFSVGIAQELFDDSHLNQNEKKDPDKIGVNLDLKLGNATPLGSFSSTSALNNKAGYAQNGIHIFASASYPIEDQFNAVGGIYYLYAPLNNDELLKNRSFGIQNLKTEINAGAWQLSALSAGGQFLQALNNKETIFYIASLHALLFAVFAPEIDIKYTDTLGVIRQGPIEKAENFFSLGVMLETGFSYQFNHLFGSSFQFYYTGLNPKMKRETQQANGSLYITEQRQGLHHTGFRIGIQIYL
jgi:hypothetical protein